MDMRKFSTLNRARSEAPNGFNHKIEDWDTSDWFLAILGELGEAANIAKKLNRIRDGIKGNKEGELELRQKLRKELGDTFIYLDLIAQHEGFMLEDAVREVFTKKSLEIGYEPVDRPDFFKIDHEDEVVEMLAKLWIEFGGTDQNANSAFWTHAHDVTIFCVRELKRQHSERVAELIAANNRDVEARRFAAKELRELKAERAEMQDRIQDLEEKLKKKLPQDGAPENPVTDRQALEIAACTRHHRANSGDQIDALNRVGNRGWAIRMSWGWQLTASGRDELLRMRDLERIQRKEERTS